MLKLAIYFFEIELREYLNNYKATESCTFLGEGSSCVQFCVPCTNSSELYANRLLGRLSLKHSSGQEVQKVYLKIVSVMVYCLAI